jgi:hypothetical protein
LQVTKGRTAHGWQKVEGVSRNTFVQCKKFLIAESSEALADLSAGSPERT